MKSPLEITLRGILPSEAVEAAIREKAAEFDLFHPHIMACPVTVDLPSKHKHQG